MDVSYVCIARLNQIDKVIVVHFLYVVHTLNLNVTKLSNLHSKIEKLYFLIILSDE